MKTRSRRHVRITRSNVSARTDPESLLIAGLSDDPKVDALVRLQVACRLALEALPNLPEDTRQALREPIEALCAVTEKQLDELDPGWSHQETDSSPAGPTRAIRDSKTAAPPKTSPSAITASSLLGYLTSPTKTATPAGLSLQFRALHDVTTSVSNPSP